MFPTAARALVLGGLLASCAAVKPAVDGPDGYAMEGASGDDPWAGPVTGDPPSGAPANELWSRFETRTITPTPEPGEHVGSRRLLDVRFDDADLVNALRLLADAGDLGLVVGDDVFGTVDLDLRRVSAHDALTTLAEAHGLVVSRRGDVVIVSRAPIR